jgi:hypothetical protein
MNEFVKALLSEGKNNIIPEEDDWYAPLIGDWEFDYYEPDGRHLKGEWFFRRVLEGTAIEDIFICPSRDTKDINPQPDGEYGVAVRMYNQEKHCYDMTYICTKYTTRLEIHKERGAIACTVLEDNTNKWVFSEITETTFHWQNVTVLDNGEWKMNCEVLAQRMGRQ